MAACERKADEEQSPDLPVMVVEVQGESPRHFDLTEKKDAYFQIPSLAALIFVETDEGVAVVHCRGDGTGEFTREYYAGIDALVPLPEIETGLALAEVYERIEF